jgi:ribosome biogenesis protein BMS1
LQQIGTLRKDQVRRRKEKQYERKEVHREKVAKEEVQKVDKDKDKRKEVVRVISRNEAQAAHEKTCKKRKRRRWARVTVLLTSTKSNGGVTLHSLEK